MARSVPLSEDRGAKMAAVIARMEFTLERVDKLLVGDDFDPREIAYLYLGGRVCRTIAFAARLVAFTMVACLLSSFRVWHQTRLGV